MKFISFFIWKTSAVHAADQFWWSIFLLSTLNFLVHSYTNDDSCQHYKRNNITNDIHEAIDEMRAMARNAYQKSLTKDVNVVRLLQTLFGTDRSTHPLVSLYFDDLASFPITQDFVLVCDDLMVKLESGRWVNHVHEWWSMYDNFLPCDPARKLNVPLTNIKTSYMVRCYIYLCPVTLDNPKGRTLVGYKNQDLDGHFINEYLLLPVVLSHELLHTSIASLDEPVRAFPPLDSSIPYNSMSLPIVNAYGFGYCVKLGQDDPDRAVHNANSVAYCVLALYLDRNSWATFGHLGSVEPLLQE